MNTDTSYIDVRCYGCGEIITVTERQANGDEPPTCSTVCYERLQDDEAADAAMAEYELSRGEPDPEEVEQQHQPRSWKPEVYAEGEWCPNGLAFPGTYEGKLAAEAWGRDLLCRWTVPSNYRAAPSDDEPNVSPDDERYAPFFTTT